MGDGETSNQIDRKGNGMKRKRIDEFSSPVIIPVCLACKYSFDPAKLDETQYCPRCKKYMLRIETLESLLNKAMMWVHSSDVANNNRKEMIEQWEAITENKQL